MADGDQELQVDADIFDPEHTRHPSEMRANAFAASFLMPADEVSSMAPTPGLGERDFADAACRLRVSPSSLAWRLHNLGIIDRADTDLLRCLAPALHSCRAGPVTSPDGWRPACLHAPPWKLSAEETCSCRDLVLVPDTTVLCTFAAVDELRLLRKVLDERGRWVEAIEFEFPRSAQTCQVLRYWRGFEGSAWFSDDRDALEYARFQGITTRETADLASEAVQCGYATKHDAFDLLQRMREKGRRLRMPVGPHDL